jgi:hypothetical protein
MGAARDDNAADGARATRHVESVCVWIERGAKCDVQGWQWSGNAARDAWARATMVTHAARQREEQCQGDTGRAARESNTAGAIAKAACDSAAGRTLETVPRAGPARTSDDASIPV